MEEEYFNVDFIPGLCNNLTINQLIVRKEVHRKAFMNNETHNKDDYSIIHCNPDMIITLLNIFKIIKCEGVYGSFIDKYWWIFSLIAGVLLSVVLIWRIWYCCDLKFERTKEGLSKLRKKIYNCCRCCNDNKEFINSANNDINLESNDLNPYKKGIDSIAYQDLRENNIRIISTCVGENKEIINNINNIVEDGGSKNNSSKSIVEEGNSHYKSNQSNLKDRENNIEDIVNYVYFPAGPYRKEPTNVFMNIIQPRKPLSFLPLDIFLPPSSLNFQLSIVVFTCLVWHQR
jgi:hypothetical protein